MVISHVSEGIFCSSFLFTYADISLLLLSEGLSSCLILLEFSYNVFLFILLGCKWSNIIYYSFSISMPIFWLLYRWYVTLSGTSLLCFCWIQLAALPGCVYCIISHVITFTEVSHLFLTCRRWLYIIWFIMCSIIEIYFVLAQFVRSHPQPCSFLFLFIFMLCVCHKLVSSIY